MCSVSQLVMEQKLFHLPESGPGLHHVISSIICRSDTSLSLKHARNTGYFILRDFGVVGGVHAG